MTLSVAKSQNIPVVIDADGLFILSHDLSQVKGYGKCILTPNLMEFKLLYDACFKNESVDNKYDEKNVQTTFELQCEAVRRLAARLENVTIVKKGKWDIISNGRQTVFNDSVGSLKRCGGIGDILTGTIGSFAYWCSKSDCNDNDILAGCYAATVFVKGNT